MPQLNCRFYQHRFPAKGDVVMVNVRSIEDNLGAYVCLLEYNNIQGMIPLSDKLIHIGHNDCLEVISVDNEKGYVDLSNKIVVKEEAERCADKFTKSKAVYSILRHVAEKLEYTKDAELESLFERTAWVFDERYENPGYGAHDAFKQVDSDPSILNGLDLTERERSELINSLRLTPQAFRIRADVDLQCYDYEGINAIKDALRAGQAYSTKATPIHINLIAHPRFMVTTTTLDPTVGLSVINQAMDAIKEKIEEKNGIFNIMEPEVVTETEEMELTGESRG